MKVYILFHHEIRNMHDRVEDFVAVFATRESAVNSDQNKWEPGAEGCWPGFSVKEEEVNP